MTSKMVCPKMVFHDIQPHRGRRDGHLRGRHLQVMSVDHTTGYAICQTVETGQTNTEILCRTLVDEAKFRFVGVLPKA